MFEKIHNFVSQTDIYRSVYTFVEKQFTTLQETLSERTYSSIIGIVDKIATVLVILFAIYTTYSLLHFLYSLIFKAKFRIMVLISLLISIPLLIVIYVVFAYINVV